MNLVCFQEISWVLYRVANSRLFAKLQTLQIFITKSNTVLEFT